MTLRPLATSWLTLWLTLTGCTGTDAAPSSKSGGLVPFPHADGFKDPTLHGKQALSAGVAACETCHREDDTAAPTCASCHPLYPHTSGWLAGETHGEGLTGDTGPEARKPCMKCHETEGLVATSEHACTGCHASYPHPEGWDLGGQHGTFMLARGSAEAACGACHGSDLAGTELTPSCTSCHALYPHVEGWADPTVHAPAALTDLTVCYACHGELGTGGYAAVACARCHAAFPHPTDWGKTHFGLVSKVGEGTCAACHEAGFGPPTMLASCATRCHGGTP